MFSQSDYDLGFAVGMDEGKRIGYTLGYEDATMDYDRQLSRYYAELQMLNARIAVLEKKC